MAVRHDKEGKSGYCLLDVSYASTMFDNPDIGHPHLIRFGIKDFYAIAI